MLDKSIPRYSVLMIKDDPLYYPQYTLPEGYKFCMYKNGFEDEWAELETAVGEFNNSIEARKYFNTEFLVNSNELYKRCIFVLDLKNRITATSSVWYGNHFGHELQRIHWVSVHPQHQGKGIAKALITRSLEVLNELEYSGGFIYLTTQTWSYKAINIYLKFGFKPYLGDKPINWKCKNEDFKSENNTAWNIIYDKLKNDSTP